MVKIIIWVLMITMLIGGMFMANLWWLGSCEQIKNFPLVITTPNRCIKL